MARGSSREEGQSREWPSGPYWYVAFLWFHIDADMGEVGAGQAGLQMGARLRQMGIRTLIIEQTSRIGDVWRKRYPTLALHTPRSHHCCKLCLFVIATS